MAKALELNRILVPIAFSTKLVRAPNHAHALARQFAAAAVRSMLLAAAVAVALGALPAAAQPQSQVVQGGERYRLYCATCHGANARGDGPLADSMTRRPTNLTEIAKRNGGMFPSELVFRTIDGRTPIRGHGGPDMPVWGDAFARSRYGGDAERVRIAIQSLVDFLESIQARPGH